MTRKMKTVKGVRDRFKVTGTGKVVAFRPGRRHLLTGKRAKLKRGLRRPRTLFPTDGKHIKALIPYA